MKKLAMIAGVTLVLGSITLAKADDLFEPGGYLNPYVIEKSSPYEYEIRPKYPVGGEEDFKPGGYFNPYIIEKSPFSDEYEIRPKFYFDDDEDDW
ncbi:MAG: hypothetical protein DRP29_07290 [Thermodesulfobacteriota bacterium]|nr:MAG: hypothetical protein DRP29_07290 [Thermodesulfobacteriota bacterium]